MSNSAAMALDYPCAAIAAPATDAPTGAAVGAPAAGSLRSRVLRGSLWTLGGYAAGQILRFGSNLILTRLLVPEMFGLMALVNIFIQGLGMFSDVGIGPSIIQSRRGDQPEFLNTAWTIQVARGFALWICSCLIAWPVAALYEQPALRWLIPVAGLSALAAGFNSTSLFTLNRHLQLGRLTILDLAARIISLLVMVVWAWYSRSVWPLVAGGVVAAAVTAALSHWSLPGAPNRLHYDRAAARELFSFGKWIFISTVLSFLAAQADRMIFGKTIPMSQLGVYSVAALMASLPTAVILKLGSSVVFAGYSRARESKSADKAGGLAHVFGRARLPLLCIGGWAVSCMLVAGPGIISVLYDRRYTAAGAMLQLLAISAWFQILQVTCGSALLAMGDTRWVAAGNVGKLIGMVIFIPVGFHFAGFPGALGGIIASDLLKYAVSVIAVQRRGLSSLPMDAGLSLVVAAALAASVGALALMHRLGVVWAPAATDAHTHRAPYVMAIAAALAVASLVWAPVAWRAVWAQKASKKGAASSAAH